MVSPGFVDTPFNAGFERQMGGRDALEAYVSQMIPMGRWGKPSDLAGTTLFLASAASDYVTGVVLPVDGGYLAN